MSVTLPATTNEMEQRVTTYSEYALSTAVNEIKVMQAISWSRPSGTGTLFTGENGP